MANSLGVYLFLHAQSLIPAFQGKVPLLSPTVAEFAKPDQFTHFMPPYPTRLMDLATAGKLPPPAQAEIHVGSEDSQAKPEQVSKLGLLISVPVYVVPANGHMLDHAYVKGVLDRWVCCT